MTVFLLIFGCVAFCIGAIVFVIGLPQTNKHNYDISIIGGVILCAGGIVMFAGAFCLAIEICFGLVI